MENPTKMDDLGGKPPYFRKHPNWRRNKAPWSSTIRSSRCTAIRGTNGRSFLAKINRKFFPLHFGATLREAFQPVGVWICIYYIHIDIYLYIYIYVYQYYIWCTVYLKFIDRYIILSINIYSYTYTIHHNTKWVTRFVSPFQRNFMLKINKKDEISQRLTWKKWVGQGIAPLQRKITLRVLRSNVTLCSFIPFHAIRDPASDCTEEKDRGPRQKAGNFGDFRDGF